MGKKTLSMIAAALFATSLGTAQTGCVKRKIVNETYVVTSDEDIVGAVERRDAKIRQDLDELVKSTHCLRIHSKYKMEGASQLGLTKEGGGHGTAFAYTRKDGYTYLVTNAHVVHEPETISDVAVVPSPKTGEPEVVINTYVLEKKTLSLVTNEFDTDTSDDMAVEEVKVDKEKDIAILRTKEKLPVSENYATLGDVKPRVGDEVYVIGYPESYFPAVTRGVMSNPGHEFARINMVDLTDAMATRGSSGSPYFIRRGDQLYWAGLVRGMFTYGQTPITMFSVAAPMNTFEDMLINPESAGKQEGKPTHE
jgi:S1-C subfamily serine protease